MIWMQERIVFQDCSQTLYSARGGVFRGRGGENNRNGKKTAGKAIKRFFSGHGSGCGRLPRRPAAPWVPGTRDMPAAPLKEKTAPREGRRVPDGPVIPYMERSSSGKKALSMYFPDSFSAPVFRDLC